METAPLPDNESQRLEALRCCNILDTAPEPIYDDVTSLASTLCDTPIALISLVDSDRQWFKAKKGLEASSTPRSMAFCAHAILSDHVLVVPDATADPRFWDNPLVVGSPGVRSYAGAPIMTAEGLRLGTVCVIDRRSRQFSNDQISSLAALSRQVASHLELRRQLTRQQKAHEEIKMVRDRLDLVVQASCDGVWEIDLSTGTIECSQQTKELLNISESASFCLDSIQRLVYAPDVSAATRAMARLLKDKKTFDLSLRLHTASGGIRWFHVKAKSLTDVDGNAVRVVGSLSDIHDRISSQERLSRLQRLLEESQSQAKVGGWEYDIQENALSWTPETYRIHDLDPRDPPPAVGKAITYYSADSRPRLENALRQAVEHGAPYHLELDLITASGRKIWVATTGKTVYEGGKPARLVGAFQDITQRVEAEQHLRMACDAAAAANMAKSSFLAMMSHEIRTPMHAILGYTELLQETLTAPNQQEYANIIAGAGHSLLRLLDDILQLSKIEAGKLDLETTDVSINQSVDDVVKMLKWQLSSKKIELRVQSFATGSTGHVKADPDRLRQVLLNLLGNAVKFTSRGTVTVRISTDGTTHACVEIADTGIGIPKDQLNKLFKDFSQVDGSSRRQYGGTGLGLAICKRLVEAMGGTIGAHSEENIGSTFWFRMPLANQPTSRQSCRRSASMPVDPVTSLRGKRALVAEDNLLNARLVSSILLHHGLLVDLAQDGQEAITLASQSNYDIIFMDCLMPQVDGFDATRAIRQSTDGNGRKVPIIALTANAMPEDRLACLDAGMNDLVPKPFTRSSLLGSLQKWLPSASPGA